MRPEAHLERDILRTFGAAPDVLLCKNEVGLAVPLSVIRRALALPGVDLPRAARDILSRGSLTFGLGVGSPDLCLWVSGASVLVELKSERGVLSPEQERWHAAARARGVRIEVERSVEGVGRVIESMREAAARGRL